jgi:hypothetical protein
VSGEHGLPAHSLMSDVVNTPKTAARRAQLSSQNEREEARNGRNNRERTLTFAQLLVVAPVVVRPNKTRQCQEAETKPKA